MPELFITILNMSISASYVALAVMLLRALFRKAPKSITMILWAILALRLVSPYIPELGISLIPSAEVVSPGIMTDELPAISTGFLAVNNLVNPIISETLAPSPSYTVAPLELVAWIASAVWLLGIIALLAYLVISSVKLRLALREAVLHSDGVFLSDRINSPFLFGFPKPRIYLPIGMDPRHVDAVIAHERAHISRADHITKPIAFLILTVHWFNPLVWLSFILFCRDVELASDERVIRMLDRQSRADYAEALIYSAKPVGILAPTPVAFGECAVSRRVKQVLSYRKPRALLSVIAIVSCIFLAACSLTNPTTNAPDLKADFDIYTEHLKGRYPEFFSVDKTDGLTVYIAQYGKNAYSCYLASANDPQDNISLMTKRTATVPEMRSILTYLGVGREDVSVAPYYLYHSSYVPNIEYTGAEEYREYLEERFWSAPERLEFDLILDTATFDVDGDGRDEVCSLRHGNTSGIFTFILEAREVGSGETKYKNVFISRTYTLSFYKGEFGETRILAITADTLNTPHLFDISVVDGNFRLTENGIPIGDV